MALETPFPSFHYHPHQEEGIRWMIDQENKGVYCSGGILADEMGLGKTWETIGLLLNNLVDEAVTYTLLLVPPVLLGQWSDAFAQSSIPHTIVLGKSATKKIPGDRMYVEVVLTTYDRAARYATELEDMCEMYTGFHRIVCDEGHILRNGERTKRYQQIDQISAQYRWLLTGTPVQNRDTDFHNLLKWLRADYTRKKDPLDMMAEEVMLRRTVAEVRDAVPAFPELKPVHYIHAVTMPEDGEEKRVFDVLMNRFNRAVDTHVAQWMILELFLRIRQFLAHPQIYRDGICKKYKTAQEVWEHSASKMTKFAELLTTTAKVPTLIFTTFKDEMEYAEAACKAAGYRTWCICGGLGAGGIDAAVRNSRKAAEEGEAAVAVLVQIQAGNAGINLQHLSRIFFLSSHWNPAIVDQAVGRSYRIGQTKLVEVHHILLADGAENNMDRFMARLHRKKRGVAKEICGKLVCDSAVDVKRVMDELNEVCPDEFEIDAEDVEEVEEVEEAEEVEEVDE